MSTEQSEQGRFAAETDPAVTAMISKWNGSGTPGQLKDRAVRLMCALEIGAISEADWRATRSTLDAAFDALPEDQRDTGAVPLPVTAWAAWRAMEKTADEMRAEIFGGRASQPVAGVLPTSEPGEPVRVVSLAECRSVFRRWLGAKYDLGALDAVLCAAAVDQLGSGDPLWVLVVSGSGNAKTETVGALSGIGARIISTISSEAALLSATPHKEWAKDATGGLLADIGDRGMLVIKDVTSILSASREVRGTLLAALREIHDGRWSRNVGSDGGKTLTWEGRLAVVGAVTTAWDTAHEVIATMGDRFVLVRSDSAEKTGRAAARRQAIGNTGRETQMRAELSAAVAGVLAGLNRNADLTLTDDESERLGDVADLVTLARTAVVTDYRGDIVDAHAPEMPTRFAKQLAQIVRGGAALGMERHEAMDLAVRCAADSMPRVRRQIIDHLAENPHSTPTDIRRKLDLPRTTIDRQCQSLHMLHVLTVDEVEYGSSGKTRWHYTLADGIDPSTLKVHQICQNRLPAPLEERFETAVSEAMPPSPSDISGEHSAQVTAAAAAPLAIATCRVAGCGAVLPTGRAVIFDVCIEHRHLD